MRLFEIEYRQKMLLAPIFIYSNYNDHFSDTLWICTHMDELRSMI